MKTFIKIINIVLITSIISACANTETTQIIEEEPSIVQEPSNYEQYNDIFIERFYYNQLNSYEKEVYCDLYASALNFDTIISLDAVDEETFKKAKYAFNFENSIFYWFNNNYYASYDENDKLIEIEFTEIPNEDTYYALFDSMMNMTMDVPLGKDDYETLLLIHDYVCETLSYDLSYYESQDIRTVLLENIGVCAGYTRLFSYLCELAAIPCITVFGYGESGDEMIRHAWNMVEVNNNWYWVDCTFDDSSSGYNHDFFLVSDDCFLDSHVPNDYFTYHNCPDNSLDYAYLRGYFSSATNLNSALDYLIKKLEAKNSYITVKYQYSSVSDALINYLFIQGNLDTFLSQSFGKECYYDCEYNFSSHTIRFYSFN